MRRLFQFARRSPQQIRADVDDELRFHHDTRIAALIALGVPPEAAADQARREFGDLANAQSDLYRLGRRNEKHLRRSDFLEQLQQDLRYAVRSLRHSPALSVTAVLTLMLGIGATTAVFSVVNSLLLHPFAYPGASRMVAINEQLAFPAGAYVTPGSRQLLAWLGHAKAFDAIEPYGTTERILTSAGNEATTSHVISVLPSFMRFAGEQPVLGRAFVDRDAAPGAERVALISSAMWRDRYNRDMRVLGKTIALNGDPYVVIGVASPTLREPGLIGTASGDVWLPLTNNARGLDSAAFTIGRLRPGATISGALAELESLNTAAGLPSKKDRKLALIPPAELVAFRQSLLLLAAAVGLVLLITLANVAHLQLARAAARSRELAIRAALGAGRGRIMRQLMTEGVVLTVTGCAGGLAAGMAALRLLISSRPDTLAQLDRVVVDWRVIAAMGTMALIVGALIGIVTSPRRGGLRAAESLKSGSAGASSGRPQQRLRSLLVVTEVALAATLLVGAGLLVRSVTHLQGLDPGFRPDDLYAAQVRLPAASYPTAISRALYEEAIVSRVRAIPGVQAVSVASVAPPQSLAVFGKIEIEGSTAPDATDRPALINYNRVMTGHFSVVGLRLVQGTTFTDTTTNAGQAIINEGMARNYWRSVSPIGTRFRLGADEPWLTVVGVVANASTEGALADANRPAVYQPSTSHTQPAFLVRVRPGVRPEHAMQLAIAGVDPRLPAPAVFSVAAQMSARIGPIRFTMLLLVGFTVLAVTLSAIGLYGVLAYAVQQRTREIGIRVALGASRRHVIGTVVQRGLILVAIGIGSGLTLAHWATAGVATLLYGVKQTDGVTFAAGGIVLLVTAALACVIPAWRALGIDPIIAIRAE